MSQDEFADNEKEEHPSADQMELPGDGPKHVQKAYSPRAKFMRWNRKKLYILAVLALIIGFGIAGWKLFSNKSSNSSNTQKSEDTSRAEPNTDASSNVSTEELSESYKSDFLLVSFKYPKSWTVKEENNALFVVSPNFKYKQKNGGEKEGFFKIYIKKGATESDGKYLGRGYAIKQSEKLTYKDPATGQRKDTYLTNFGVNSPDNFAYFIVQGNFNLMMGDTLGPKFASEPDALLISAGYGASDLTDPLATNMLGLSDYSSDSNYQTAVEIVKTLQLK